MAEFDTEASAVGATDEPIPQVRLAGGPPVGLAPDAYHAMVAHAITGYPLEACGLLGGVPGSGRIDAFAPAHNTDESAKTYAIGPAGFADAEAVFAPRGFDIIGVMHSHTHTDAYPSPTDIDRADNPFLEGWKYVIVSLRDEVPVLRSYLLDRREVIEEIVEIFSDG
ncbi:MAG TPA: M67 family metallopeptidase [Acidimicrobiales bacterium]|nr:M67 family metallopeptidase [Acidimicrobiales bacterium]